MPKPALQEPPVLEIADTTDPYRDVTVGEDARRRATQLRNRFLVALPLGTIVMVLSMVPALQFPGWQWVVAALTLPVITWCAWPFHKAAFAAARHGATTMDTLVSLGIIASSTWSYWALFWGGAGHIGMKMNMSFIPRFSEGVSGHAELYFEAATMIVVFLLAGRWAEARTRYRAGDALRSLLDLGAKEATLVLVAPDGSESLEKVPAADLSVGDLFLVRPGEKVATDGVIEEGNSALDTSLLTGESVPVDVSPGESVTGGTINTWGSLRVRATRVGSDTTLAQIGRMVTEAQATKAPVQRLADKVSAVFVPVIISIALVTLVVWLLLGNPVQAAFTAAVAVLVVACPCALGLATPTALLVGSGRASQLGILIRNAEVLEQTRTVDTAVLDKTGTVTSGVLSVEEVVPSAAGGLDENQVLALSAAVEEGSEHPLARAIVKESVSRGQTTPAVTDFANHAGKGVSGLLEVDAPSGELETVGVLVGGPRWLSQHGIELPAELLEKQSLMEATGATVVALVSAPPAAIGRDATAVPTSLAKVLDPASLADGELRVTMTVQGMTCASCVGRVERKLKKLPGVSAQVNLATETATITLDQDYTNEDLEGIVKAAGYDGHVVARQEIVEAPAEDTKVAQPDLPPVVEGAQVLGLLCLRDSVKPDAAEAISELRQLGINPILLSGDNTSAANHVAGEVGIETVIAEVLPDQKRDEVARLQEQGHVVAMIGDGVNDAAAMAQASTAGLGLAMGSGTDVAMAVADITAVNSDLKSAPRAIRISRRTLRIIKGNLFWAFFYNILAVPLAFMGLLNPMIAAAAMAFSSVFVVMNSLRLRNAG